MHIFNTIGSVVVEEIDKRLIVSFRVSSKRAPLCSVLINWNANSDCLGRDLIGVQNLIKKHQAVVAEINNHENRIYIVTQAGNQMIEEGNFAADDIKSRINNLNKHWSSLKEKAAQVFPSASPIFD